MTKLITIALCVTLTLSSGCSALFGSDSQKTKVYAAPFGTTAHMDQFKKGYHKPSGHVVWGTDIDAGAPCEIVITSTSLGKRVYYHSFQYSPPDNKRQFQFTGGKILEPDPFWHHKVGRYVIALYVKDRRISTKEFDILP